MASRRDEGESTLRPMKLRVCLTAEDILEESSHARITRLRSATLVKGEFYRRKTSPRSFYSTARGRFPNQPCRGALRSLLRPGNFSTKSRTGSHANRELALVLHAAVPLPRVHLCFSSPRQGLSMGGQVRRYSKFPPAVRSTSWPRRARPAWSKTSRGFAQPCCAMPGVRKLRDPQSCVTR